MGMERPYRVGVDIGGTFTDLILVDDRTGVQVVGKALTTPDQPALGVETVLRDTLQRAAVAADAVRHIVHGTTLVTNAIIERKGARTALLTTAGFRDAVEIGREHRYDMYDIFLDLPRPLVPRYLRFGLPERILADGTVQQPLDADYVRRLVSELAAKGVEALAVSLLHAYRNPAHERQVAAICREVAPHLHVALSSDVVPEMKEYQRASTTICNVYVQALVERYLSDLAQRLRGLGFAGELFVMLSSGGISTVETAQRYPVRLLESGPAAGALAAATYGKLAGLANLLSFDMGGTTAKLCIIADGQPLVTHDFEVDRVYRFKKGSGLPVRIPVIEMVEIGAGGGSIARVGELGTLKVGPDSAGADPGPACYGRGGTLPTVTDADLVLGYLDPDFFLGGRMRLDRATAERAIATHIARPLGLSLAEAAWGIHQIVDENMASAARIHAVERGKDPRSLPLFAFGGAGPGHAFRVAEILRSPRIVVPFGAGVTSTVGFLAAPLAFDFVRSRYGRLVALDWAAVSALYAEMEREGLALLARAGVPRDQATLRRTADMRYVGQGHEVAVPIPAGPLGPETTALVAAAFTEVYRQQYGRTGPDVEIEALSWRLLASGPQPDLRLGTPEPGATSDARAAIKGQRPIYLPDERAYRPVPVYDRYRLAAGARFAGPAIIEERECTIIVPVWADVAVDAFLNVHLVRRAGV
jgi:N-methylhydantoinase A